MKRIKPLRTHEFWMKHALRLARRGEGLTSPNPPVGAVAVKNGKVVGEGYHRRAGGPHAEVVALSKAGTNARGCTLYVTLEPCSTWGRTPPCTNLILSSGVRKVVVSVHDPNPRHSGRGLTMLRRKGVSVVEGVCVDEGMTLIAPFTKWISRGVPYVTLKLGMSVDGKIADRSGRSRWITGPEARKKVHELRRRVDGILVGGGTVRNDNPSLLPRPDHGRRPWRIAVARNGRIPGSSKLLADAAVKQTLIVVSNRCPAKSVDRLK
jgi:diaminohydroxyphosphoribosylaminopyrimidine deaminase/5-amino-6-(5-phosphoribosylamino)uracil reductase